MNGYLRGVPPSSTSFVTLSSSVTAFGAKRTYNCYGCVDLYVSFSLLPHLASKTVEQEEDSLMILLLCSRRLYLHDELPPAATDRDGPTAGCSA